MKGRNVEDNGLTGVHYAGTKLRGIKVYELGGTIGPDGKATRMNVGSASADQLGSFPISKAGITDETVQKAWWVLASGYYEAYGDIAKLAKRSGTTGEEATALLAKVEAWLTEQAQDLISKGITGIGPYEKAERLSDTLKATGSKELRDLNGQLKDLLKEAARTETMKDELKARDAFQTCVGLAGKNSTKSLEQALAGFTQIADKFGSTHYGKLSSLRAAALKSAMP